MKQRDCTLKLFLFQLQPLYNCLIDLEVFKLGFVSRKYKPHVRCFSHVRYTVSCKIGIAHFSLRYLLFPIVKKWNSI